MTVHSGQLLVDGHLVPGRVETNGDRITAVEPDSSVTSNRIVSPGLIDLQVNGGHGVDFGEEPHRMSEVTVWLPTTGCTAFLPTIISSFADRYRRIFDTLPGIVDGLPGARILGLHLEGPFLSSAKKGAHSLEAIETADDQLFDELLQEESVRLVTLAPERSGALDRIAQLVDRGVLVSLGHTNATFEEFATGIETGARMTTHLFNAMSQLESRAPGAVGAALIDDRVAVGVIADGIHTHPAILSLIARMKDTTNIALVSDMMGAAGMPPGTYSLNDIPVHVDETSARLQDGRLAGSILTMDAAVRNITKWGGISIANALTMATRTPARLLGRNDLGALTPGALADLVIFHSDLTIAETWIGGERVYSAS